MGHCYSIEINNNIIPQWIEDLVLMTLLMIDKSDRVSPNVIKLRYKVCIHTFSSKA